jgi:multiple sugar transport system ATP-binding protein
LNLIAGLETITKSGEIRIGDRNVSHVPPKDRDIAMVFQSYALYPNMNVRRNLSFGLETRKVARPEIEQRISQVAEILQIQDLTGPQTVPTLRRAAPAGGHGPGHRPQSAHLPL